MITIHPIHWRHLHALTHLSSDHDAAGCHGLEGSFRGAISPCFQQAQEGATNWAEALTTNSYRWPTSLLPIAQQIPRPWQQGPLVFVAQEHKSVLGAITLMADGQQRHRWRIVHRWVDPNEALLHPATAETPPALSALTGLDVGQQLLHYALNRLGGDGVQHFLVTVAMDDTPAQAFYKQQGFRQLCQWQTWESTAATLNHAGSPTLPGLREATQHDHEGLKTLLDDALPIEKRATLSRRVSEWNPSLWQRLAGSIQPGFSKRWVIDGRHSQPLMGSLSIQTEDFQHFQLNVMVSPGWNHRLAVGTDEGWECLLNCGVGMITQMSTQPKVRVVVPSFWEPAAAALKSLGFELTRTEMTLVRDYWEQREPVKAAGKRAPVLLLGAAQPAPLTSPMLGSG